MNTFLSSYKIELYKLLLRKKYIVFTIIGIIICIFKVGIMLAVNALSKGNITMQLGNLPIDMLMFFAEIFLPLIVFMASTDLLSSEFQDNTIRAMLLRPVTRFKLLLSKSMASFTITAGIFMLIYIVCTVLSLLFGTDNRYILQNLCAYLIDLIPMLVLVLMSVLINLICKSPTLSMFICFLIYAVMKYCNYFVPLVNNILFTSFNRWHQLWIGSTLPLSALFPKIFLLLGSAILFFTLSYYLFDKKDI